MAHPILDAQDALKAILAARGVWADVAIRDGGPTEGEDILYDMFWFNDTIDVADNWNELGARSRRVAFRLGFTIAVRKYGDDERSARARALELFQDLMLALKATQLNASLNNTVQQVEGVNGTVDSAPVSPSEWGAWFTGTLEAISKSY